MNSIKNRKRIPLTVLILLLMITLLLSACGSNDRGKKLKVVTTIFPLYDWTREVIGNNTEIELTLLEESGADLHSYQPTAADMAKIAACVLFIYVGGESDEWTADALKASAVNPARAALNLMEVLHDRLLEEEEKEGMEVHDHEAEKENDEHIWLSLKNAQLCTEAIGSALEKLDADGKGAYVKNAADYGAKLETLRQAYAAAAAEAKTKTLLFGDRFPFRYLTEEMGLDYYAAFSGCSAESEASFETIVFLAGKLNELGLKVIMKTESSDGRIAETIRQASETKDQKILTLDSLQAVTADRVKAGAAYLAIMEENLEVLKEALR